MQTEQEFKPQVNPFGGGMDWLEVRLPEHTTFRLEIRAVIEDTVMKSSYPTSLHYAAVIDLRPAGHDAILHLRKKRGPEHSHKLQFTGAAQFGFSQHVGEIESITDANPYQLEPMRTDLTVDLRNVPVSYFVDHGRVQGKQFANMGGEAAWQMGKGEIQTFYAGKRPNCFRVYNKTAERYEAYKAFTRGHWPPEPNFDRWKKKVVNKTGVEYLEFERVCAARGLHPSLELQRMGEAIDSCYGLFQDMLTLWREKCAIIGPKPTFEEFCGMRRDEVITRFERQIGAQQIKGIHLASDKRKLPIFSTLADLRDNLPDFDPFSAVSFSDYGLPDEELLRLASQGKIKFTTYMAGMYYRGRVQRESRQLADAWVRRHEPHHGKEILARLAQFAPPCKEGQSVDISSADLYERYRSAVTKQLAA